MEFSRTKSDAAISEPPRRLSKKDRCGRPMVIPAIPPMSRSTSPAAASMKDKSSTLFTTGISRSRRQSRLLKDPHGSSKRRYWSPNMPRSSSPRVPESSGITLSTNLPPLLRYGGRRFPKPGISHSPGIPRGNKDIQQIRRTQVDVASSDKENYFPRVPSCRRDKSNENFNGSHYRRFHSQSGQDIRYNPSNEGSPYLPPSAPPSMVSRISDVSIGELWTNRQPIVEENDTFSRQVWSDLSGSKILATAKLVDLTKQKLIETSEKFNKVPVALRDLSLSITVVDHCFDEYAQKVKISSQRYRREEGRSHLPSIKGWRHPSGVVSFAEILGTTLKEACTVLHDLEPYSTFMRFLKSFKLVWLASLAGSFILSMVPFEVETQAVIRIVKSCTVDLTKIVLDFLRSEVAPLLPGSAMLTKRVFRSLVSVSLRFYRVFVFLTESVGKYVDTHKQLPRWTSRLRLFFLFFGLFGLYSSIQRWHRKKLSEVNFKICKLLQYWHLCMSSVVRRQSRLDRSTIYRAKFSVRLRKEANYERWSLGLVPPSSNIQSCFWYNTDVKMKLMKRSVDITYATLSMYHEVFGSSLNFFPFGFFIFFYYCLRPGDVEVRANQLLAKPDLRLILFAWSTLDGNFARWVTLRLMPLLKLAPSIPVLMRINFRVTNEEEERFKSSLSRDMKGFEQNQEGGTLKLFNEVKTDVKVEEGEPSRWGDPLIPGSPISITTIPILFLSVNKEDEIAAPATRFFWFPNRMKTAVNPTYCRKAKARDVIFFVHGGAFVANFCALDLRFLSIWANQVGVPVVRVDYRLSPKSSFPAPLVDCYVAYRDILKGNLGFPVRRIVIVGDSNGCLLAVALTLKLLQEQEDPRLRLMLPTRIILSCPVLNLRPAPSTSRILFMMDPLISNNLFNQCRKLFLPSTECYETNYYVSPLVAAPDALLKKFPPCAIVCGGYDPFCDDAIDWAHRLDDNGVSVALERFERLPHMFLAFGHIFPESERAIKLCGTWMQEAFSKKFS